MADEPLLEVRDLAVDYLAGKSAVRAVDGVSLQVQPGEFLGIVGESGCGKSTLLFAIGRLLGDLAEISQGSVLFKGHNLVHLRERQLRHLRWRDFSVVMQSAMNALNPVMTIEAQLLDAIHSHSKSAKRDAHKRAAEVLRLVGIDPLHLKSYPHQLSGGMRQRAMIAMAIANDPALLIADEPTTALDVTLQAHLLDVLERIRDRTGSSILLITHDLGVVAGIAERVAVMYAGRRVEEAPVDDLFAEPRHPYTLGLLASLPRLDRPARDGVLFRIPGQPPSLVHRPDGCAFHPRCAFRVLPVPCATEVPADVTISAAHRSACHRVADLEGVTPDALRAREP